MSEGEKPSKVAPLVPVEPASEEDLALDPAMKARVLREARLQSISRMSDQKLIAAIAAWTRKNA